MTEDETYVATAVRVDHETTQYDGCALLDVKLVFVASRSTRAEAERELAGWVSKHPPAPGIELLLSIDLLNEHGDLIGRTAYTTATTIKLVATSDRSGPQ